MESICSHGSCLCNGIRLKTIWILENTMPDQLDLHICRSDLAHVCVPNRITYFPEGPWTNCEWIVSTGYPVCPTNDTSQHTLHSPIHSNPSHIAMMPTVVRFVRYHTFLHKLIGVTFALGIPTSCCILFTDFRTV